MGIEFVDFEVRYEWMIEILNAGIRDEDATPLRLPRSFRDLHPVNFLKFYRPFPAYHLDPRFLTLLKGSFDADAC